MMQLTESVNRPLRGKPAQFARLERAPLYIPNVGKYASLYQLQEDGKTDLADATGSEPQACWKTGKAGNRSKRMYLLGLPTLF